MNHDKLIRSFNNMFIVDETIKPNALNEISVY